MIIGNGSIAKLLNDRDGFVFFAAGLSDSQMQWDIEKTREEGKRIGEEFGRSSARGHMFVYFSTISIFTHQTPYTKHKLWIEATIKIIGEAGDWPYTIIRLGNVWECTNQKTFINAYKRQPYEPRDEYKYMISKEQLNFITDNLPKTGKHEISIFGEMVLVKDALKHEIRSNTNLETSFRS
jgi:hypothetical protein